MSDISNTIVTDSDYTVDIECIFDQINVAGQYQTTLPSGVKFFSKLFVNKTDCTSSTTYDPASRILVYSPYASDYVPVLGDEVLVLYCINCPITLIPLQEIPMQTYKVPPNLLPSIIAAGTSWNSGAIIGGGYTKISVSMQTSQPCSLFVTRFIDIDGSVAYPDDPQQIALLANQDAVINILDGQPFGSFAIRVANTGSVAAETSNFFILLNS